MHSPGTRRARLLKVQCSAENRMGQKVTPQSQRCQPHQDALGEAGEVLNLVRGGQLAACRSREGTHQQSVASGVTGCRVAAAADMSRSWHRPQIHIASTKVLLISITLHGCINLSMPAASVGSGGGAPAAMPFAIHPSSITGCSSARAA